MPSLTPNRALARIAAFSRCLFVAAVASSALHAQHVTIAVDSGRPMSEAVRQLQKLTSIPIHYEDLQYYFAADLQAPSPGVTGADVPKGGSFSVDVPVDLGGKLPDDLSVATALNTVIAAAQAAGAVPGTFSVDSSHPGVFFVEPATHHTSTGSTVPTQPALDTPVSISLQEVRGIQVLDAIFQQVSQKTGSRFGHGMGTLDLAIPLSPKVSITATSEPAKFVLAKLLADVGGPSVTFSYMMLCGPNQRYYAFNIRNRRVLPLPAPSPPYSPPPLVPSGPRPGMSKKSN